MRRCWRTWILKGYGKMVTAQTPWETECIKFDNIYRIEMFSWRKNPDVLNLGDPMEKWCHWSLFPRDHMAAFHSLSIKSPILLCSAVQSLNKSPNAFYFTNTKMSCGLLLALNVVVVIFYSLYWTEVCQAENSGAVIMKNSCVLFAIPTVKWHPFYWDFNLRDQKKEQCDSKMKRNQISESFELCSEVFS